MYQAMNIGNSLISQASWEIVEKSSGLSHILWNISPRVFFDFEVQCANEWSTLLFRISKKTLNSQKVKNHFLEEEFWFCIASFHRNICRNWNRFWDRFGLNWSSYMKNSPSRRCLVDRRCYSCSVNWCCTGLRCEKLSWCCSGILYRNWNWNVDFRTKFQFSLKTFWQFVNIHREGRLNLFLMQRIQKKSYKISILLFKRPRFEFFENRLTFCFSFWSRIDLFGISEEKFAAIFVVPNLPANYTLIGFDLNRIDIPDEKSGLSDGLDRIFVLSSTVCTSYNLEGRFDIMSLISMKRTQSFQFEGVPCPT